MELIKREHACVELHDGDTKVVIDPGAFSEHALDYIAGAAAVLITHDHFDHFTADTINTALKQHADLRVYAPSSVVEQVETNGRITAVKHGDHFSVGSLNFDVVGEHHAVIHPDIPGIANVGFIVNGGAVFHPGDNYTVPETAIDVLLVPTSGPWSKFSETIDFIRAVGPKRAVQIHELILSDAGQGLGASMFGEDGLTGVPFSMPKPGETISV